MNLETLSPYALPLAGGLAGAALYHLLGPMLRGCIAVARFAFFLFGWALEAATGDHEDARAFAWRCVYEKEPASQPFDRLRSVESELVGIACHAAKVNVRLDALEERADITDAFKMDCKVRLHQDSNDIRRVERDVAAANERIDKLASRFYNTDDVPTPPQAKVPYGSQVPEKVPPLTLHNSSVGGLPDWIEYCGTKYYAR